MAGARIEEPEEAKVGAAVASIFGIPLMKGIFLIFLYRDDVMMIHCCVQRMTSRRFNKVYTRRHHGGLREYKEMFTEFL